MQKYYIIKNSKNALWNDSIKLWGNEATFFTEHGMKTYVLPKGGYWIYAVSM